MYINRRRAFIPGDLNGDNTLNILDIIIMANMTLGTEEPNLDLADLNNDEAINILDIITLVNIVLNGRALNIGDNIGTNAIIYENPSSVSISSNGQIAGIQMTVISDNLIINEDLTLTINTTSTNNEHIILIYGASGETLTGDNICLFETDSKYEIKNVIIANVLSEAMSVERTDIAIPNIFILNQNYPNPFNPNTVIEFTLGQEQLISLNIFDIQGRLINSLINNDYYKTGSYNISWDGTNNMGTQVPSGMYIYKLIGQNHSHIRKMVLMK